MTETPYDPAAEIALAMASCVPPQPVPDELPPGCRFAEDLRPGDGYLFPGRVLGEDSDGMYIEMHPVTVIRGPEPDTTSDPFGREMIRFRVRSDLDGHEGNVTFGPVGGVVRMAATDKHFVIKVAS